MKIFEKTGSAAGADQVNAIEESVNTQIGQMFDLVAKKKTLDYGVGRTVMTGSDPDNKMRRDAQNRECDAGIVFHAGRALELARLPQLACDFVQLRRDHAHKYLFSLHPHSISRCSADLAY